MNTITIYGNPKKCKTCKRIPVVINVLKNIINIPIEFIETEEAHPIIEFKHNNIIKKALSNTMDIDTIISTYNKFLGETK